LSKIEAKKYDYLEELKSNYRQRIQESDNFSKRFSTNSSDYRSKFLSALLELSQYYIDLQKKFISRYPKWYDDNLMTRQSQIITEIWVQTMRNMDSFYSEFLDYTTKNLRAANRIAMEMMRASERYYDMFENVPHLQRDAFIELIKEAKKFNDNYLKDNLEKRTPQSQKTKPKKETLTKDIS
jgi:hypothetical protein